MSAVVVLVTDDPGLLGTRYPDYVERAAEIVQVVRRGASGLHAPDAAAGVVDTSDVAELRAALDSGRPLLLTVDTIAAASADGGVDLSAYPSWTPYLPLRRAVDVAAAVDLVTRGAIGRPRHCDITTYTGTVSSKTWEPDATYARSQHEALVFALDVAERLLGTELTSTRWSREAHGEPSTIRSAASEGIEVDANHTVLPASLATAPTFSALVTGDDGRILLRQPFAPGAVTVWDASSRQFRCPALRRPKANVQAPDTALAGRETAEELEALLTAPAADDVRHRALRLTQQALAATEEPIRDLSGGVFR